ncbi:hypothetical protein ACFFX0_00760 [Citricoccus parietis]|uniref:Uncharacterized protein n=1 Tax=Citricoccus parietis TaxID=592307 RepID=A0ABV5FT07_9MICC
MRVRCRRRRPTGTSPPRTARTTAGRSCRWPPGCPPTDRNPRGREPWPLPRCAPPRPAGPGRSAPRSRRR